MLAMLQNLRRTYRYDTRQYAAVDLLICELIGAGDRNCDRSLAQYLEARRLLDRDPEAYDERDPNVVRLTNGALANGPLEVRE